MAGEHSSLTIYCSRESVGVIYLPWASLSTDSREVQGSKSIWKVTAFKAVFHAVWTALYDIPPFMWQHRLITKRLFWVKTWTHISKHLHSSVTRRKLSILVSYEYSPVCFFQFLKFWYFYHWDKILSLVLSWLEMEIDVFLRPKAANKWCSFERAKQDASASCPYLVTYYFMVSQHLAWFFNIDEV